MYLNTHTYYSICYGTLDTSELLEWAQASGCDALVLTDINTTSACVDFVRQSPKYGIKPIVGVDFRLGTKQQFIAIAQSNHGFQEINSFLSHLLHEGEDCPDTAPAFQEVFVIYPLERGRVRALRNFEFIGVKPHELNQCKFMQFDMRRTVILQPVTFRSKRAFNAHRLLRAIDNNCLLSKLPESEQGRMTDAMQPVAQLVEHYRDFPQTVRNTKYLLEHCRINFDFSPARCENQLTYTGNEEQDWELLQQLCSEGLNYRYPQLDEVICERIERELEAIRSMGFVSYFLINWDIVSYAQSKGYFYVGRGSGANSVIAYLLRITDVDPIELNLYFERFINAFRTSPPDFDIDFAWTDREDMTRYIFDRFNHVALVATYNTFKDRSVVRELGKVFGLPKEEIDKLVKGRMETWEMTDLHHLVVRYGEYIRNFPSNLSIHASGIVISERPIHYFSSTFMPPKGYPTIQFDMHVAEDMGWYKFDILSQRGLSKIKDTLTIIAYNQPQVEVADIHAVERFKADERIKELLRKADAVGCFYVESPAMRMLLRKLQVDTYLGLVAASSVIRPGVAKSGMMNAYIQRFRHPEKRQEAHPVLLDLMPETFGVMVYQEDVIKVAHYFAGLTLGEADKMRRGMSGKFRSRDEFQAVKEQFFKNCLERKGHSLELTAEVWRQTESFAGYAFAKGHSASYAVESYQCLYLKAYFPIEYMVATVNNGGGFFSTELYLLEAKRLGACLEPCCVNSSEALCVLQGKTIFLGFQFIDSLERKTSARILQARSQDGQFNDFDDFLDRVSIGLEQLVLLIRANAFRFTGKSKKELLWEAHLKCQKHPIDATNDLFRVRPKEFLLPALMHSWEEDAYDQLELFGFTFYSYFNLVIPDNKPAILARDLRFYVGKDVWIRGYLVHAKKTITSKGELMFFGTLLDEEGEWLDTVHFPDVAKQFLFRGKGVYLIYGRVYEEYDCLTVEAKWMEKCGLKDRLG